jgi:hypothetical protein
MSFDGTPLNMSTILVTVLAVVAALMLLRKKYDSNLPLMFYVVAVIFTQTTDRAINPLLLYGGMALTLILRFEFMNAGFAKVIAFFATSSLGLIIYVFLSEAFGDGTPPF